MSSSIIPVSLYPNVPDLPGVPALSRLVGANLPLPILSIADTLGIQFGAPQWGIFDSSNNPVVIADSVVDMDYHASATVPTYPLEQGAFSSYNKVQAPYDAVVTLTCGGNDSKRTAFLTGLETAKTSLTLYSVVTPEKVYINASVNEFDYSRKFDKGVSLITAEIKLSEIRITATSSTAATASPNGATTQNTGTVQTISVTSQALPNLTPQ